MNGIKYIIIVLLLCFANLNFAAENNIMFEKANQLYHNKNYDSAAKLYQQMIEDGYCHADLYYNAGNAYYRINKTGMAIWCFKKALMIDNHKNYRDNLLLAQKKIKKDIKPEEEIFFMRWWRKAYNLMSVNKWGVTSLAFFLIFLFFLTLKNIFQKEAVSKKVTNFFIVLTCFSLFFSGVKYYNDLYHYHGIIVQQDADFTSGSKSLSTTLSDGIEVVFISRKNNRMMVKLPDGRIGEIQESAFKRL